MIIIEIISETTHISQHNNNDKLLISLLIAVVKLISSFIGSLRETRPVIDFR